MANEPKRVILSRASPIGDDAAPRTTIEIHAEVPEPNDLRDITPLQQLYTREATALADALFSSLPGGTIDALLGAMLHRRASMFCVPFVTPDTKEGE